VGPENRGDVEGRNAGAQIGMPSALKAPKKRQENAKVVVEKSDKGKDQPTGKTTTLRTKGSLPLITKQEEKTVSSAIRTSAAREHH